MSFLDDFFTVFAQSAGSTDNNYLMKDQRDVVREHGNMGQQNLNQLDKNKEAQDNEFSMESKDSETGEEFAVDIRSDKGKSKSKKELEWINKEMTVTFTSLTNKNKFLTATLDSLCNGKYADLAGQPLNAIAETLCTDYNSIFSYADSSLANYSERITPDQAFRIAKSISSSNRISLMDYDKISSKLSDEHGQRFNDMLRGADLKIFYPMEMAVTASEERRNSTNDLYKKAELDRRNKEKKSSEVLYYVGYIKDFKEYKLGRVSELRPRVASVLATLKEDIRNRVTAEFENDSVLKNLA